MSRPTLDAIYMRFAQSLAERSTCKRLQVGAVITTNDLEQVLAIGYNGNAKGRANTCDSDEPGACGCIHAELNAQAKCGRATRDKIMFTTDSPCPMCAKIMVNSGYAMVCYWRKYRKDEGIQILKDAGIEVRHIEL